MARAPKFPGLQQRYESALVELLAGAGGRPLKMRELVDGVAAARATYEISDAELEDLQANFANYTSRAKDAKVLVSSGPWGGYKLGSAAAGVAGEPGESHADASPPSVRLPSRGDVGSAPTKPRTHWESLLHLPLTVALSGHFSARVQSLQNATDSVRWGNPDMLMLRPSPLTQLQDYDSKLDPELFGLVDVTPECILASIEVKGGLDRDRARFFTAIAETAANSRWANEAWLVFVDWTQSDAGLDEDVVSLARSVEVGLLEVQILPRGAGLRLVVHHAAPTRATLRIAELRQDRVGVLRATQDLLREWKKETPTFLDVDFAEQKTRVLMQQAIQNVRRQKGFVGGTALGDLLKPLRDEEGGAVYVTELLQAALRSAGVASGVGDTADLAQVVSDATETALVMKEATSFKEDLAEFGRTALPAPA